MSRERNLAKIAESTFSKLDKVHSEIFTMTYGAIVTTLVEDLDNVDEVNAQLDKMGHNIGERLVDELLAKTGLNPQPDMRYVMEIVTRVGFRIYLGITPTLSNWNADSTTVTLSFRDSALSDWVELPHTLDDLSYFQLVCGVIRGALEMLGMKVKCTITADKLKGAQTTDILVELQEVMQAKFYN
ncbi:Transport protein particle (TRAPP) component [Carpediemonas membranifera]|uniref:Trafficking protein particle complex subunit n=1 Tax=Carpediemonas membranifera TaxID=201153 RepID=A0A8J6AXV9_9EUKA|nr:Transport protein particle (TRAPP) component [Carpediemonas membranifera]|eukprot:KAG9391098.1 Transport protein particle (TRAPP) component [Carpediemonas membranifera]